LDFGLQVPESSVKLQDFQDVQDFQNSPINSGLSGFSALGFRI
jgi:hypothetical protein